MNSSKVRSAGPGIPLLKVIIHGRKQTHLNTQRKWKWLNRFRWPWVKCQSSMCDRVTATVGQGDICIQWQTVFNDTIYSQKCFWDGVVPQMVKPLLGTPASHVKASDWSPDCSAYGAASYWCSWQVAVRAHTGDSAGIPGPALVWGGGMEVTSSLSPPLSLSHCLSNK